MDLAKPSTRTLLVALALGLAVDLLFHDQSLGISVPIFVVLLLGALLALGRAHALRPAWSDLWLAAPVVFIAAMVGVRANAFLTFLNLTAVLALLGLIAYHYAANSLAAAGLAGQVTAIFLALVNALYRAAPMLKESLSAPGLQEQRRRSLGPALRGCLLALPVLAFFAVLLASADLVFGRYLAKLLNWSTLWELIGRAIVVLGAAWFLAGGLAYALRSRQGPGGHELAQQALDGLARLIPLGLVEAGIVLGAVDALFASFVWVQLRYLFGGQANVTAQGFTYAEYARRGFVELVAVAVLTLGLILGLHRLTRRETPRGRYVFSGLGSLMVVLVLVMLASAFQRLRLYEQAYGFTELRLYVYVYMAWLGVSLAWFLATLWYRRGRFAPGALAAAVGLVVTLNLINPDAFIAGQNLARYCSTGKLDVRYLTTLSVDAVPALAQGLEQVREVDGHKVLEEHLAGEQRWLEAQARRQRWQSFHLSRWLAANALAASGKSEQGS